LYLDEVGLTSGSMGGETANLVSLPAGARL
jgi:hypothetical protein